jgi:hypothetical protein
MACTAEQLPYWITFLTALLTPTVAVAGVVFAWLQLRIVHSKLLHAKFDQRFERYLVVKKMLANTISSRKVELQQLMSFSVAIRDVKWLFDDRLHNYLFDDIRKKLSDLRTLCDEEEGLHDNDAAANSREQREILNWLEQEFEQNVDRRFDRYLRKRPFFG